MGYKEEENKVSSLPHGAYILEKTDNVHLIKYINEIHMKSFQIMISGMKGNMGNKTVISRGTVWQELQQGWSQRFLTRGEGSPVKSWEKTSGSSALGRGERPETGGRGAFSWD